MQMLSATDRSGSSDSSWNTQTMPCACASPGLRKRTACPSRRISPSVGATTPEMILISVLLPAPFSPITAWIEPAAQASEASDSATVEP